MGLAVLLLAVLLGALLFLGPGGGPRNSAAPSLRPRAAEGGPPAAVLIPGAQFDRSEVATDLSSETPGSVDGEQGGQPPTADLGARTTIQRMAELTVRYDCIDPLRTALKLAPMADQVADASRVMRRALPPDPIGSLVLEASPGWHIAWLEGPGECSRPQSFELRLETATTIELFGLPSRDMRLRVVSSRTGLGVMGATVSEQFHGGLISCTTDSEGRCLLSQRPGRRSGAPAGSVYAPQLYVEAPGYAGERFSLISDATGDGWSLYDPFAVGPSGSVFSDRASIERSLDPSLAAPPSVAAAADEVVLTIEPLKRVRARLPREFGDRDPRAFEAQVRGYVTREGHIFIPVQGRVRREGPFDLWIEDLHPRGNYCIEANSEGLFTQPTLIPAGLDELDLGVLPLALPASLSGTLVGVRDRAALLDAARCRCDALPLLSDELPLVLGSDGSFKLERLLPGKYRIVLTATDSYERARGPSFELHPGEARDLGVVVFE